jgi:sulfatase maturation enzyme AslB (radical SAM superfamily)
LIDHQIKYKNNIAEAMNAIDCLPDLTSVSFIGGEFFIFEDNIKVLEKIKQRNLTATIFTNATIINPKMLEILKQITSVEIRISIDGIKQGFEFVRYPASWSKWESNVALLRKELPHAQIHCATVIQMLTCQQIHEMYNWTNRARLKLNYLFLTEPKFLEFTVLNNVEKHSLIELLVGKQSKYSLSRDQKEVIDSLTNMIHASVFDEGQRFQCVNFVSKLCVHRKIKHEQVKNQFGVLTQLGQEIVNSMQLIESTRTLQNKNV